MPLHKRSLSLSGHRTSLSLETEFWAVLDDAAKTQGRSLASLIAEIDDQRGLDALASSVRIWALNYARNNA